MCIRDRILGSTISGLVSRSILREDGGWHACVNYAHLSEYDVSQWFVDTVDTFRCCLQGITAADWQVALRHTLLTQSQIIIEQLIKKYDITNLNRLKPGIAEATRAVMRRVPEHILVQHLDDPNILSLIHI